MLLSSSNWQYPPFLCYHIFQWLCAWGVCYIIFYLLLHINSGKTRILFPLLLRSLWWVQIVGYVLACSSYLFVCTSHHLIFITYQSYLKTLNLINVRYIYFVECVRLSIFSKLSIIQYMGLCVFSLPVSFVMIERIYILCLIIIIKSEVWTIIHCLGSGNETMVCALCLAIFLYKWSHNWTLSSNSISRVLK